MMMHYVIIFTFIVMLASPTHSSDVTDDLYSYDDNELHAIHAQPPLYRTKRTAARNRFYTYGIVPYTFRSFVTAGQRAVIRQVMSHYENMTCIRFVPRRLRNWQMARSVYNLGHGGYVDFTQRRSCFGGMGNTGRRTVVSCCNAEKCLHEIGHALGMIHEHENPGRAGFIRINYKFIRQPEKVRYMLARPEDVVEGYPFDLSSPMGYDYHTAYDEDITLLAQDLSTERTDFYMFQEISENHRCKENNCSTFSIECVNDGYVTLIHGACACRCPEGLNASTGCATTLSEDRPNPEDQCGGVVDLNSGNTNFTFTKPLALRKDCIWLVRAPPGDTIYLDFNEFDIEKRGNGCEDELEIRLARLAQPGKRFCGEEAPRLVRSYFNTMLVRFHASERTTPTSVLNATARLVSSGDLCYNAEDKGFTYDGTLDHSRDYTACIDWADAAHCPHSPYNFKDMSAGLTRNYCRNPGDGVRPWCYTDTLNCKRKYCDVCAVDTPYNTKPQRFCGRFSSMYNYCRYDQEYSRKYCAKQCKDDLFPASPSASTVTCTGPPTMDDDSEQIDKLNQTLFGVGESVTFRCRHENSLYQTEMKRFCLTSGRWSEGNTSCIPCHIEKGYVLYKESCYKIETEKKVANQHLATCESNGGTLADIRSSEEQAFVTTLGFQQGVSVLYIGANDMYREGVFRFRDHSPVTWRPWDRSSRNGPGKDCVWSNPNNKWMVERCNKRLQAVCKGPMLRHERRGGNRCHDARDDCSRLLEEDPDMCSREHGAFAFTQCTLTCNVCF